MTHLHTAGALQRPAALLGLQDNAGQRVLPRGVPPSTPVRAVQVEEDAGGGFIWTHSAVQGHSTDGPGVTLGGHLLEEMGMAEWWPRGGQHGFAAVGITWWVLKGG